MTVSNTNRSLLSLYFFYFFFIRSLLGAEFDNVFGRNENQASWSYVLVMSVLTYKNLRILFPFFVPNLWMQQTKKKERRRLATVRLSVVGV